MPSEVRFSIVKKKLADHGWTLNRISGSHHIFVKKDDPRNVSIPVHGDKVMPVYVKKIDQICGEGN